MSMILLGMGFFQGMLSVSVRIEPMFWFGVALMVSSVFACSESKLPRLLPAGVSGVFCGMSIRWAALYGTREYNYFTLLALMSGLLCAFLLVSMLPVRKKPLRHRRRA